MNTNIHAHTGCSNNTQPFHANNAINDKRRTKHIYTFSQGLPFLGTIVQREFTHIAYALLFNSRLSQAHVSADAMIFFYVYTRKIFYGKKCFF